MDLFEAMEHRHAVRSYEDRPIAPEAREALLACIAQCNRESGLHIQLVLDEPRGFGGLPAHYGKFSGVKNYIALIGKKSPNLEEACGYYGEKIVLRAQQLGLNTCWVAMTYSKGQDRLSDRPGREALPGDRGGLRHHPGHRTPGQAAGRGVQGGFPCAGLVPAGRAGGAAGAHSHEPAEIYLHASRRQRGRESRNRLLHQGGPGHCQIPF